VDGLRLAFTTDSFVVSPLFFPGGDIGSLAVHGTVNDLAMDGAQPLFLSAAFIIEEGLPMETLRRVVASLREAAASVGGEVVTGDTKVVEKGRGDQLFINTSGLGRVPEGVNLSADQARPGDRVLLSGSIGDHGIAILAEREGLEFESPVVSDSAPLHTLVAAMLEVTRDSIRCLRDPTRGGLSSALNEFAGRSQVGIVIDEQAIPVREEVKGACEGIRKEHRGAQFIYNITGGTKLMAQAALADAAEARDNGNAAWAVYVDTENARLVKLEGDGKVAADLYDAQRLKGIDVVRYFEAYGVTARGGTAEPPPDPWPAAARAVARAQGGSLLMQSLARFSEPKAGISSEVTWKVNELSTLQREALEKLVAATGNVGVQLHGDQLTWPVTKESKDFIWRRHWLEWYTFDCLQEVAARDPAWYPPLRNVKLGWPGWDWDRLPIHEDEGSHKNELDVTTTRGGRLLICECKAGEDAPTPDHIYKLQVVGYKAGTFTDKVLVTGTPYLTDSNRCPNPTQVIRALTLDILLVGAETLQDLSDYLKNFDDWLYEQQIWFDLRRKP
jgi:thiamine monophosphate kinase